MPTEDGLLQQWNKRYLIEYLAALTLCLVAAGFSIPLAHAASSEVVRLSLMAVPTFAIWVMAIVVFRHFRRVDEFTRRLMLECFALTGAFAFLSTLTYGIFEIAGFPKISTWWGFGGAALVWNLWMLRLVKR
jgi:O-antigen/teichoic acid export membrane protein